MAWKCSDEACKDAECPPRAVPMAEATACIDHATQCGLCNRLNYPCECCHALVDLSSVRDKLVICRSCGFLTMLDKQLRSFLLVPALPYENAIRNEIAAKHELARKMDTASWKQGENGTSDRADLSESQKQLDALQGSWALHAPVASEGHFQLTHMSLLPILRSHSFSENDLVAVTKLLHDLFSIRDAAAALKFQVAEIDALRRHQLALGLLEHGVRRLHRLRVLRWPQIRGAVQTVKFTTIEHENLAREFARLVTPCMRLAGVANRQLRLLVSEARDFFHVSSGGTSVAAPDATLRARRRKKLDFKPPSVSSTPSVALDEQRAVLREKIQLWRRIGLTVGDMSTS
ncbi:Aste57867_15573 [Aphanomyces stellatus]|uniref:Aste57867_15573 protein n=1 Tax=Aphanomyces stellatus TaxID=120398 RepID=A0A485L416_9STRA|nr:hypothetical protein As57867_015517 [Aphanomyces stellatus]VFT92375.1 Aste57867_15573 [Aphanomyces stellatus]